MKNNLLFCFLAIYAITIHAQCEQPTKTIADPRLEGLEAAAKNTLNDYHAAGLAIAIVENGKTIYSKGIGYRDHEKQIPADEQTLFCLGSCTKAFTASMLGILEGQGKLSLHDRPVQYIPELEFYNDKMNEAIQIRHLLSHSTGLSNMSTESSMVLFQPKKNEDLIPRLKHLAPAADVGEDLMYCNLGYTVAAVLSERITGADWKDNMDQLIFEPMGMNNTTVGYDRAKSNPNLSIGYAVNEEQIAKAMPARITGRGPAGDVFSNAEDMAKWMMLWLNEGKQNGQQILPFDYVKAATSRQQKATYTSSHTDSLSACGYGWFMEDYPGYHRFQHSGAISGYTANVVLYPDQEIGIAVLTNQANSNLTYVISEMIENRLFDIDWPATKEDQPRRIGQAVVVEPAPAEMVINKEQPPTHELNEFIGEFTCKGYGTFSVFMKNENLYVKFPFTTFRLVHEQGNVFGSEYAEDIPTVMPSFLRFTFQNDETGMPKRVSVNMDAGGVVFEKEK